MSEVVEGQTNTPETSTQTETATPAVEPKVEATAPATAEVKTETATTEVAKETPVPKAEDKPAVPEKYELKLQDGSRLDKAYLDKIASEAKEQGLSQEQAQKLVDHGSSVVDSFAKAQQEALTAQVEGWKKAALEDKEIGGAKFEETVERAHRNLKQFGTPELITMLDNSGLSNHPEVIRAFARIPAQNGTFIQSDKGGSGNVVKSAEERLYGKKDK